MSSKITVEGIILVLTCNKYKNNKRLRKLRLTNYNGWKVIYVVGNLLQTQNYIYNPENNFLSIKVEDSYLHLYKKFIKSIEILYELYDIKQGILRCGDDLVFNEENLINPTIWSNTDSDFKLQKTCSVIYKSKSQIYNNLKDIESNKVYNNTIDNNTIDNNTNDNNYLYYFTTFGIFYVILRLI